MVWCICHGREAFGNPNPDHIHFLHFHPAKVLVSLQMVTDTADVDMFQPEHLSNDNFLVNWDVASRCFKCVVTHPLASTQTEAKIIYSFLLFNSGVIHPCSCTIISYRHVSGSPSKQINGCWRCYAYLFRSYFICLHLIILQNGGVMPTQDSQPPVC